MLALLAFGGCSSNIYEGIQTGESSNDAEALVRSGEALLLNKQNTDALDAFNRALAIDPDYPPALRGRASALLNQASPSGSFAVDFSSVVIGDSSGNLSQQLDFTLSQWQALDSAISDAKSSIKTISSSQRNDNDKYNLAILGTIHLVAKARIAEEKTGSVDLSSDYSNLSDVIDVDGTNSDKVSWDEALQLVDEAIADSQLSGEDSDFSQTLSDELGKARCEICYPTDCNDTSPEPWCTTANQPDDCQQAPDSPTAECS
jgi:tetratricopeptide (TPR) repeat protein